MMRSDNPVPVTGDVIGNTAYSQRFVLKMLLNLAKIDENERKEFEDDLCTLWDMTTEKDVAVFLHEHDALNLIYIALSVSSPRIKEILIGILGNMCCQKRVADALLKSNRLLTELFEYLKSDDTTLLIQLLRLMTTCLYMAEADDRAIWMDIFVTTEHSTVLYYILEYSANIELLNVAIEHFNTICGYFNTETHRTPFFTHFVRVEALKSLATAFKEIIENQSSHDHIRQDLEMIFARSLQIAINLVGFENSTTVYIDNKEDILTIITPILSFYVNKLVEEKEIDIDLIDIIDTINTLVRTLKISIISEPDKYFKQAFKLWKSAHTHIKTEKKCYDFEEKDKEELEDVMLKLKVPLCNLLCTYIAQCSEENWLEVLDHTGKYYDEIVVSIKDTELALDVSKRMNNYQTRLKETEHP